MHVSTCAAGRSGVQDRMCGIEVSKSMDRCCLVPLQASGVQGFSSVDLLSLAEQKSPVCMAPQQPMDCSHLFSCCSGLAHPVHTQYFMAVDGFSTPEALTQVRSNTVSANTLAAHSVNWRQPCTLNVYVMMSTHKLPTFTTF